MLLLGEMTNLKIKQKKVLTDEKETIDFYKQNIC